MEHERTTYLDTFFVLSLRLSLELTTRILRFSYFLFHFPDSQTPSILDVVEYWLSSSTNIIKKTRDNCHIYSILISHRPIVSTPTDSVDSCFDQVKRLTHYCDAEERRKNTILL